MSPRRSSSEIVPAMGGECERSVIQCRLGWEVGEDIRGDRIECCGWRFDCVYVEVRKATLCCMV